MLSRFCRRVVFAILAKLLANVVIVSYVGGLLLPNRYTFSNVALQPIRLVLHISRKQAPTRLSSHINHRNPALRRLQTQKLALTRIA